MSESTLAKKILLAISQASRGRIKLFRNNVGVGVSGKISTVAHTVDVRIKEHPGRVVLRPGDYIVRNGRRVTFGLFKGSSDYIGWTEVIVSPSMIGTKIAVFTGIETKTPTGTVDDDQIHFAEVVRAAGGYAGVARSADEAIGICNPLEIKL